MAPSLSRAGLTAFPAPIKLSMEKMLDILKKYLTPALVLLLGWTAFASCQAEDPVKVYGPAEGLVDVSFKVALPQTNTKVASPSLSNEEKVNRWALYIYTTSDELVTKGFSGSSSGITFSLAPGTYKVVAVVNSLMNADTSYGRTELLSLAVSLSDNSFSSLMMCGAETVSVSATGSHAIPVTRCVSRVGLVSLTRSNGSSEQFNAATFKVTDIYLSNVVTRGYEYNAVDGTVTGNESNWYCKKGVTGSNASLNSILLESGLNITVVAGGSHSTSHYFYAFPNPVSTDTRSETWSPRHTRLVIKALVGDTVCYYPVTIPVMEKNVSYNASVTISDFGSADPETDVPVGLDVTFGYSVDGWAGPVNVSENS